MKSLTNQTCPPLLNLLSSAQVIFTLHHTKSNFTATFILPPALFALSTNSQPLNPALSPVHTSPQTFSSGLNHSTCFPVRFRTFYSVLQLAKSATTFANLRTVRCNFCESQRIRYYTFPVFAKPILPILLVELSFAFFHWRNPLLPTILVGASILSGEPLFCDSYM